MDTAADPPAADVEDTPWCAPPLDVPAARAALLAWYDAHHRVLPWRRTPPNRVPAGSPDAAGPGAAAAAAPASWSSAAPGLPAPPGLAGADFGYGVLVSEVMSQQTQVERAAAFFCRWVARWPTLGALAAASEEDVVALWAGLGYYGRARRLLALARSVAGGAPGGGGGGELPRDAAALQRLPGVGPYTAAAVASIAFGAPEAALDGNVARVLARLHARPPQPQLGGGGRGGGGGGGGAAAGAAPAPAGGGGGGGGAAAAERAARARAQALLDPDRPGDWNQAMMELGATLCGPSGAPRCAPCPLAPGCGARALQAAGVCPAAAFPPPKARPAPRRVAATTRAVLAPRGGGGAGAGGGGGDGGRWWVLLRRRPHGAGMLAGLWELPTAHTALTGAAEGGGQEDGGGGGGGGGGCDAEQSRRLDALLGPCRLAGGGGGGGGPPDAAEAAAAAASAAVWPPGVRLGPASPAPGPPLALTFSGERWAVAVAACVLEGWRPAAAGPAAAGGDEAATAAAAAGHQPPPHPSTGPAPWRWAASGPALDAELSSGARRALRAAMQAVAGGGGGGEGCAVGGGWEGASAPAPPRKRARGAGAGGTRAAR